MDLDNIKKTWQETEMKPAIDEKKIEKMISNKGQSAFNSLLKHERNGIIMLLVCIPLGYLIFNKYLPVMIVYLSSIVVGLVWQVYKFRKLKEIDMSAMSITDISNRTYSYRKTLMKELAIGIVWLISFIILFGYFELLSYTSHYNDVLIILIIMTIIALVAVIILYKILYWKNLKKLEESIKEVQEFEKENG